MPQQDSTTSSTDATRATTTAGPPPIGATVLGYPRIGRRRELKTALEAHWAGDADVETLRRVGREVRADAWAAMSAAGLDSIPVTTFSWYDQVLDAALLVGAVPERFAGVGGPGDGSGGSDLDGLDAARYFALARGTDTLAPLEMTKWFDTNYHYLVPEIGPDTVFTPHPDAVLSEYAEARARGGASPRPVLVGPYTLLTLAKAADGAPAGYDPLDRLPDLLPVYADVLRRLREAGADWVQLDEPAAALDLDDAARTALTSAYEHLTAVAERPALLLTLPFADPVEGLPALAGAGVEAVALDLVRGPQAPPAEPVPGLADTHLVLGVVEGRNVWRTDLRAALDAATAWAPLARSVSVGTSCSLLHVPYDVETETALDPALRADLAFADQKLAEVAVLHRALTEGPDADGVADALAASDTARAARADIPGLRVPTVSERVAAVEPGDRARVHRDERRAAQAGLGLPPLPTTTIGSYPQTREVRRARADHRAGRLDAAAYTARMHEEIAAVVRLQEDLGLDVLVHGEPERNDMVQYFAELLAGFATTAHGWVQSYGSRCVRPPVLFGDVHRPEPMTVPWATFAQGLTDRPLKGMLTGPVTILAWSFVRTDQPRRVTADQVALALRAEVADLEAAGLRIVQVDEPALRETLPLRRAEQADYLDWSVGAFRLATSGVAPATQVHTHLCYSEFGEIVTAIDALDADVTSVEAARSRMELLADVAAHGFAGAIGPGVYDIHSPRVPGRAEITDLLERALRHVPADRLWVNPDCGLKTRGYAEVEPALRALVGAAREARQRLG